jgi:hypothetical protein
MTTPITKKIEDLSLSPDAQAAFDNVAAHVAATPSIFHPSGLYIPVSEKSDKGEKGAVKEVYHQVYGLWVRGLYFTVSSFNYFY